MRGTSSAQITDRCMPMREILGDVVGELEVLREQRVEVAAALPR